MNKFKVSITGCGLGDFVYNDIDFASAEFKKYQSKKVGDGGLHPGNLVFAQELERFAGKPFKEILEEIAGKRSYNTFNIGGPALVSMIGATQLLYDTNVVVQYYGARSNDDNGNAIEELLSQLPVNMDNYRVFEGETPYTDVLSDPHYSDGKGERTFINNIACAAEFTPDCLDDNFWNSDMIVFGGTALVPQLHRELTSLLQIANNKNAITLVNTVYDFPNEKLNPTKSWPLGDTLLSLPLIDLLIMDYEESLRISGADTIEEASGFFKSSGSNAFIITHGANPTYLYSSGQLFAAIETTLPICNWIASEFAHNPQLKGDTTGCGDNFTGAVIASVVKQLMNNKNNLSLVDAAILGTVSGGFTCYYIGGTYFENEMGERTKRMNAMLERYLENEL